MSGDGQSHREDESLVAAMETGAPAASRTTGRTPARRNPATGSAAHKLGAAPQDFRRPQLVSKVQLQALESLHDSVGRNFAAALSSQLRSIVEVTLRGVEQLTYGEFAFGLENPTCVSVLRAAPLEGNWILEINSTILYPIIDRLLGGGPEKNPVARRPLTEIELRLVSRITALFLAELHRAWESILELDLAVDRVERNPQLATIVPPNEVVALVRFELALGDSCGTMNLCIPLDSIERIGNKIWSSGVTGDARLRSTRGSTGRSGRDREGSTVELVVHLAETHISASDLDGLNIGDIITTETSVQNPLSVSIGGATKFRARPGALHGHKAIEITDVVTPGEPTRP